MGLNRGQSDVRFYTVRHRELRPEPVDDDLPRIADNTPTFEVITRRLAAGGDEHLARGSTRPPLALAAAAGVPLAELVERSEERSDCCRRRARRGAACRRPCGPRPSDGPGRSRCTGASGRRRWS